VELLPPAEEGWYRTQIPDWVALHPQMTHTAFRLYCIVPSLVPSGRQAARTAGRSGNSGRRLQPTKESHWQPRGPAAVALQERAEKQATRVAELKGQFDTAVSQLVTTDT
jgi:hypothetical protein